MDKDKLETARLRELLNEFLQWCDIDKGQKAITVRGKYNKLINLVRWLEETQQDFTLETLNQYKLHLFERRIARDNAVKEKVLNGVRSDLKSNILPLCSWLYEKGHIKTDWKKEIDLPPARKKDHPVQDDATVDRIIDLGTKPSKWDNKWSRARKLEYRDALRFIARTGCRIGVIYELKKQDVNISTRICKVYSKGKIHHLSFSEDLVSMMELRRVGTGKVFDLKRSNQQMMNKYVHRGCKKLDISQDFTVHSLRHSRATNMLGQNIRMYTVQKSLGHKSIQTTIDVYGHLDNAHVREAINLNPQVQRSLTLEQRRANIRSLMESAGLTKMDGMNIKFEDTDRGIVVSFDIN